MRNYARKRDFSENPIVSALETAGAHVVRGTDCDLYVRFRERPYLLECKTKGPNAKRRQPIQVELAVIFGSQYIVVEDAREALLAIGAITP